ncbi:hypothetical protein TMS3_0118445 [Pseudomonas taeanensis MS-3]|jgi:hypothetical protein|uniref:Lipoprotein n=1 Tax=Pseudomonas taeanensis MS-3 TaxID=1395571 RepID=A0A0A1YEG3_9PSED|nr:I78 family peptidase inhibitor [Pseudomonas taeanensis]KFX68225.1 hypothetical protein TMS3_0118445 [Pseudomonas taeanensis MS-3]
MRCTIISSSLVLLAILAGCSSVDSPDTAANPVNPSGKCNADAVQSYLGQTATPGLVKQIRQQAGARTARVLRPSDAMTLDYNSRRLNIDTDEAEVIDRITCG